MSTRLSRLLLAALALSVLANVAGLVVYSTRTQPHRPDWYRMGRIDLFQQLGSQADFVMLGDSLTDHGEWDELLGDDRIANRGIAGDTIAGATHRIDSVLALKPTTIAVMLGINDLLGGVSVDTCAARYAALVDALKRAQPAPRIVVQSVLPIASDAGVSSKAIQELNAALRAMCAAKGCEFLDLFPRFATDGGALKPDLTTDGVHLTGSGYKLWTELLRPVKEARR